MDSGRPGKLGESPASKPFATVLSRRKTARQSKDRTTTLPWIVCSKALGYRHGKAKLAKPRENSGPHHFIHPGLAPALAAPFTDPIRRRGCQTQTLGRSPR